MKNDKNYVNNQKGNNLNKKKNDDIKGNNDKTKKSKVKLILLLIFVLLLVLCAIWLWGKNKYKNQFLQNTTINGINVSSKKLDQVMVDLKEKYPTKILEVVNPDKTNTKHDFTKLGAKLNIQDKVASELKTQNTNLWFTGESHKIDINPEFIFDPVTTKPKIEESLKKHIEKIDFSKAIKFDEANAKFTKSTSADKMGDYSITKLVDDVYNALEHNESSLNLTSKNSSSKIDKIVKDSNNMINNEVNISFGNQNEKISKSELSKLISINKDGINIDNEMLGTKLAILSKNHKKTDEDYTYNYDTRALVLNVSENMKLGKSQYYVAKEIKIKIEKKKEQEKKKGQVNKKDEEKKKDGEQQKSENNDDRFSKIPSCSNPSAGTYINVDKKSQTLCAIVNGKPKYSANVVTGDETKGHGTPEGTWQIWAKKRNETLSGEGLFKGKEGDYRIPVKYWMPIDGTGVGLHSIDPDEVTGVKGRVNWSPAAYLNGGGSHGCVNMHTSDAGWIFENMPTGTSVHVK